MNEKNNNIKNNENSVIQDDKFSLKKVSFFSVKSDKTPLQS